MGVKGGLNYSINQYAAEITSAQGTFTTTSQIGYQLGTFLQWELSDLYLRPEAYYSLTKGEFSFPNISSAYSIKKVSLPVLIGCNISERVSVFVGPAYQHILESNLDNVKEAVFSQQRNLAAQVGLMLEFQRLQIDLRYDFTFNSPVTQQISIPGILDNALLDDGRLNQFMLSVSYKLFAPGLPEVFQKRNSSCYF
ncbi:hypothetical protein [Salinimicrobium sp. HB62]|uniref:hypothetical protein n=1 Tax=Salinimicrobium sp. HB62 TaxID=3077781 RepID=UPI003A7F2C64